MHYNDSVQNPSTEDTPSIKDRGLGTEMSAINSVHATLHISYLRTFSLRTKTAVVSFTKQSKSYISATRVEVNVT